MAQAQAAKEKEANANEFTKRSALNCGTETRTSLLHASTSPVQFASPDSATFVASERTHPPLLKYPPQRPGCGFQHNIQRLLDLKFGNGLDTASSSSSSYDQRLYVCLGIEIKVPHPFPQNFPWGIRDTTYLPWEGPDSNGHIRSLECANGTVESTSVCDRCSQLRFTAQLRQLEARANDASYFRSRVRDAFLTLAQLQQRREYQQQQFSLIRLRLSAAGSKLRRAVEPLNDLKLVTIALATGKISRIPALAKILLKRGSKPSTVAAMFERAVDGFVPHGEFEKEEVEKTVALLILGGHAAVRLARASQGGPTAKTARRSDLFKSPRFFVCSGPVTVHTLCHNLGSFLSITPPPNEQCAWHLSMDNVNIEERLRYSHEGGPLLGGLKGVARESSYTGSLKIVSYADFLVIKEANFTR